MEPEEQPVQVHDPSKKIIMNDPQRADNYGAAARGARILTGTIPEGTAEGEGLEVPPEGSVAVQETDLGPAEAAAEKVGGWHFSF